MTEQELFSKLIQKQGKEYQIVVLLEEMGELIQALMKIKRPDMDYIEWVNRTIEELVDVQINLDRVKMCFPTDIYQQAYERKIHKLKSYV